jgi:hypothetical protein
MDPIFLHLHDELRTRHREVTMSDQPSRYTRRDFVQTSTLAAASIIIPRPAEAAARRSQGAETLRVGVMLGQRQGQLRPTPEEIRSHHGPYLRNDHTQRGTRGRGR